jgi:hypothetical protein
MEIHVLSWNIFHTPEKTSPCAQVGAYIDAMSEAHESAAPAA